MIGVLVCLAVILFRVKGYLFMETFSEAKYVAATINMNNIFDIFSPAVNGENISGAGPLYYFILNFFAMIFGGFSEFAVRVPSVLLSCFIFLVEFFILSNLTNKKYALTVSLITLTSVMSIFYMSISSPYMIAECFAILSVLLFISPFLLSSKNQSKSYFFFAWFALTLSVLIGDIRNCFVPLLTFIIIISFNKEEKNFSPYLDCFPGAIFFLCIVNLFFLLSAKVNNISGLNMVIPYYKDFIKTTFLQIQSYETFMSVVKNIIPCFFVSLLPWTFCGLAIIPSEIYLFSKRKFILSYKSLTNEEKFFRISIIAFFISIINPLVYCIKEPAILYSSVFFACCIIAHYWYMNIVENRYQKVIYFSSVLFYFLMAIVAILSVLLYFFLSSVQKTYVVSLIPPVIFLTLIVSIPGIIAVLLKRKIMNYSVHILFSITFFFLLTGLFFNYINSFGENDLVNFAIKARKDGARLATYDITNKFSMLYYYKSPIVFNKKMTPEEIHSKYGDVREVYLIVKLDDLSYFDKYFVYEILASGKKYCEITNIKYLPTDELSDKAKEN
jgi:hypothetical protein